MIQNVTKSCRELAKYVRIKETLLNAARGPEPVEIGGEGGGGGISSQNFALLETKSATSISTYYDGRNNMSVIPNSTFHKRFMTLQKNNLLLFVSKV